MNIIFKNLAIIANDISYLYLNNTKNIKNKELKKRNK